MARKSTKQSAPKPVPKSKRTTANAATKAAPIVPTVRRARGGRKVTTGRRSAGAADFRVRLSAEEAATFEELAKAAGFPSVAAWLRSKGRRDLEAVRDAEPTVEANPWPATFVEFASEVLGLTLTVAQRTLARVAFDRIDPCDLTDPKERRVARELFGGVERIPASARGALLVLRLGRASGKSLLTAAWAVYRLLVADLSACGPGDTPAVCIVSPRRDTSRIVGNYARAFAGVDAIAPLVTTSAVDGFTVRRPDGREVRFAIVPKSAGGSSLRGLSLIAVVVDESEFVPSAGPAAVIQDGDIIDAAIPRGLPGFLIVLCSTPWPATSATSRAFDENYGHPSTALAALGTTLTMRDHEPTLAAKVAAELVRSPANATREYECQISEEAMGGAFFAPGDITRAVTDGPILARRQRARAGIDPAFIHDGFALAIVEEQDGLLVLVHSELISPKPQSPLIPSEVVTSLATTAATYGCRSWHTDKHKVGSVRVHATAVGVATNVLEPEDTMIALREALREGRVVIPNDPRIVAQLRGVTFKPRTGGGLTITSPRSRDSGHGDIVSALAMACAPPRADGAAAIRGAALMQQVLNNPNGRPGARQPAPSPNIATLLGGRSGRDRI